MKPSTAVHLLGAASSGVSLYVGINAISGGKVPKWFLWLVVIGGGFGVLDHLMRLAGDE